MHPRLIGVGTAVPPLALDQHAAMELAARLGNWDPTARAPLERWYRRSGIDSRGSVLLNEQDGITSQDFFRAGAASPGSAARFDRFEQLAPALAMKAAERAIQRAQIDPTEITHLIVASCTGASAPGVDAALVSGLSLRTDVQRMFVGFMGCAAAIPSLAMARAICAERPASAVLVVCVELCSLHLQYTDEASQTLANALFADGAGAAIVRQSDDGLIVGERLCTLVPESSEVMTWRMSDHGMVMGLSPRVPEIIRSELRGAVDAWLGRTRIHGRPLSVGDIAGWVIHPGGPRVIEASLAALGLPDHAGAASREVLRAHGNMSSSTVFFVHERLAEVQRRGPVVWLGFAPGLTIEGLLMW